MTTARHRIILSCLACCSLIFSLKTGSAVADELNCATKASVKITTLDGIEKRYKTFSSLKASFVQTSYFVGLDKREQSKGEVLFQKPGKMSWNYMDPTPQSFISDGKSISFYQPKLNQVTLSDFKESFSSEVPVTFLLGIGSLQASFEAVGSCKADGGLLIELKPKKTDATLSNFYLLVDEKELTPLGAKVIDLGGNETTIRLIGPVFDSAIPASQFLFSIPKGVDVIDNRGPSQAGGSLKEENLLGK